MVAERAFTMKETTEREIEEYDETEEIEKVNKDKKYSKENKDIVNYDDNEEDRQTMNIYEMEEGTIFMLGKMNIKLPSPTQFDGHYPRFNECAGETSWTKDIQDKYVYDVETRRTTTYPKPVVEGENGFDDYMDMTVNIKTYYKWLEDINRHEAKKGRGTITDQVKIATVVNNLKGNIAQNLRMRINQATTFDDVHQWVSNYFNSTYTLTGQVGGVSNYDNETYDSEEYNEEEYDENWAYDNNDPVTIAFMKGKARRHRKGKGKGKKGDNGKGKEGKTVTCYTCGKQGHTSTFCYYNKGKNGKGQNKGYQPQSYYSPQQPGKGYPQQPPQQPQYYSQP
eukprot:2610912-Amphidinium_carterae.4